MYQVNLTRRLSAPMPAGGDVAALGAALAEGNPAPYSAVVRLPAAGCLVASASPERFLSRDGDVVSSGPIKGTAPDPSGLTAKDRAENVMIVDLVRNDLGRVCDFGSVAVPSLLALEHHPGLVHLVSTVTGRLRAGCGWAEAIAATFPPGSVTGAPKVAALEQIAALEPVPRGVYCGAVGWVDADRQQGDLNVAIRTFWVEDEQLHFGTGGGITWDSDPDDEWAETELKARNLLRVASGSSRWLNRCGSNGSLVDAAAATISIFDHGLTVGDGVFETLKAVDGRPVRHPPPPRAAAPLGRRARPPRAVQRRRAARRRWPRCWRRTTSRWRGCGSRSPAAPRRSARSAARAPPPWWSRSGR